MPERSDLLAEAYKRNILPPDMRSAYEEAQKRGMVGTEVSAPVPQNVSSPVEKTDANKLALSQVPMQALKNVPSSAVKFGEGILSTIAHPIEAAKNIGRLGLGAVEKATGGGAHTQYFDAAWNSLKDRYGGYENIKHTVATDPIGVLADISTIFSGGETALARIPALAKAGEVAGTIGKVTNPITPLVKTAEKAGEYALPKAAGLLTGKGEAPFRTAIESAKDPAQGQAFRSQMRDPQGSALVKQARDALARMRAQRSAQYQREMQSIKGQPNILDFRPVWSALQRVSNVKNFKGIDTQPSTGAVRAEITNYLYRWAKLPPSQFHTAAGFDALKQLVGDTMEKQELHSPARKVASEVYEAIKAEIVKQDPHYAEIMKDYSQASDLISEVEKTLAGNKKTTEDTSLRKILSSTRSQVNTNFGRRGELAEILGRQDRRLVPAIAGHVLNPALPSGLAQLPAIGEGLTALMTLNPKFAAALAGSSPRVMGEGLHGASRAREFLRQNPALARRLLKAALAARAGGQVQ